MSRHGWKGIERKAAALFGLERWPANMGYRFDFGGGSGPDGTPHKYVGQVKNTKSLSQTELVELVNEMEEAGCAKGMLGVVVTKMSARKPTPLVVSMSGKMWEHVRGLYEMGLREQTRINRTARLAQSDSSQSSESASGSSAPSLPSMPPGTGLTGTHRSRRSKGSATISQRRQAASAAASPSSMPSGTSG